MSKFGWDLPPGVTHQMIEDQATGGPEGRAAEAFFDNFYEAFARIVLAKEGIALAADDPVIDSLCEWVWQQMGEAYNKGYKDGMVDEQMVRIHQGAEDQ